MSSFFNNAETDRFLEGGGIWGVATGLPIG
jgi:hypothetical protein